MIVIVLDCADEGLRGFLSRWLLELKANCFVGNVNAAVREQLWDGIIKVNQDRFVGAVMAYSMNTEQGFDIRMIGEPKRYVQDFEGIKLITYRSDSNSQESDIAQQIHSITNKQFH